MLRPLALAAALLLTASGGAALADQAAPDPRVALLKELPAGSKIEDLRPSPIAGLYEFVQGADVSYITVDGKYFVDGNLYDMKSRENLTEEMRAHARVAMVGAVPESEMLIFSPPNPKYTITVFTDVDCAYCRKLHQPDTIHIFSQTTMPASMLDPLLVCALGFTLLFAALVLARLRAAVMERRIRSLLMARVQRAEAAEA